MSKLGDGVTKIESVGEINEIFYRNNWTVRFKAVVCKQLSSQFIGGTVFMVDNGIEQDFSNNVIRLLNKTVTVVPTDPLSLLPTAPINEKPKKVNLNKTGKLLTFNAQWLLPDQKIAVDVPNGLKNETTVGIQPWDLNSNMTWPQPQLKKVINGKLWLENPSDDPILLGKEVKRCMVYPLESSQPLDPSYYHYQPQLGALEKCADKFHIETSHIKCAEVKDLIDEAHRKYSIVFNKDLRTGYNNFYGTHVCKLN